MVPSTNMESLCAVYSCPRARYGNVRVADNKSVPYCQTLFSMDRGDRATIPIFKCARLAARLAKRHSADTAQEPASLQNNV